MKFLNKDKTDFLYSTLIIVLFSMIFCSCYNKKDINDYEGNIVIKQHCGFDGLEDSYYILKNPKTKDVFKVSVDGAFCNIYSVNDTIK